MSPNVKSAERESMIPGFVAAARTLVAIPEPSRRRIASLLQVLMSVIALGAVLRLAAVGEIPAVFSNSNLLLVTGGVVLQFLTRLAAAERTQTVTRAMGLRISRRQTVETLFVSNFYSLFLPDLVAGGVSTVHRYGSYGVSWEHSMGALLLSRMIEFAVFLVVGSLALAADPLVALSMPARVGIVMAIATSYALGLAAMSLLSSRMLPGLDSRWIRCERDSAPATRFSKLASQLMRFKTTDVLRGSVLACAQLLLWGAGLAMFAAAMNIELALATAIWIMAAIYVATVVPLSIAGLGIRELTLVHLLGMMGVAVNGALALSLLLLFCQLLWGAIGGFLQARSGATI